MYKSKTIVIGIIAVVMAMIPLASADHNVAISDSFAASGPGGFASVDAFALASDPVVFTSTQTVTVGPAIGNAFAFASHDDCEFCAFATK